MVKKEKDMNPATLFREFSRRNADNTSPVPSFIHIERIDHYHDCSDPSIVDETALFSTPNTPNN